MTVKDFIGAWLVPAVLALGSLAVAWREIISWRRSADHNGVRLLRRLAGCLAILGIGALMFAWMHHLRPVQPVTPEQQAAAREVTVNVIWCCLGLLSAAMALAVWDVLDGLRGLGRMVDRMSRDDLHELEQTIGRSRKENPDT